MLTPSLKSFAATELTLLGAYTTRWVLIMDPFTPQDQLLRLHQPCDGHAVETGM
jgi:hypothetical protein